MEAITCKSCKNNEYKNIANYLHCYFISKHSLIDTVWCKKQLTNYKRVKQAFRIIEWL